MFFCHPFHLGSLSKFVSTNRHFSYLQRRSKPYIIPVSKLLFFQLHLNPCCYPQRLPSTHFILCMNNRYMINDLNTLLNTISHIPQYWFSPETIGCNLMPGVGKTHMLAIANIASRLATKISTSFASNFYVH